MDLLKLWPVIAFAVGALTGAVTWATATDWQVKFLTASRGEIYERINAIEWERSREGK